MIARIEGGKSISQVASDFSVSRSTLWRWLESDPQRSARAREARQSSAESWDDKAERTLSDAGEPFELARARELAQHYRWRASKIAPKVYGDKLDVTLEVNDRASILRKKREERMSVSSGDTSS